MNNRYDMKFEGVGKIHGDLESKDIQIEGAVKVNGLVSADNIRIEFGGNSYVNEIGGEKITIDCNSQVKNVEKRGM